jgi:hypothetical protein
MMDGTQGISPRVLKGALVGIDLANPVPRVIVFQYNPHTLTRTLRARAAGGEGARTEALRLAGAPEEEIRLEVDIDATDQLEKADPVATTLGIYPQLSALETLLYPASTAVVANTALLAAGTIEVVPTVGPFTLLIWGAQRILPVRIADFTVTEDAHDVNLNPIRAKVALGLKVLGYDDLPVSNPGYHLFLAHQVAKEAMAVVGTVADLTAVTGGNVSLL